MICDQIDRYLSGALSSKALATWAFNQFGDVEEELLSFEPGSEHISAEVIDQLMWADSVPFTLEAAAARSLKERLETGIQGQTEP